MRFLKLDRRVLTVALIFTCLSAPAQESRGTIVAITVAVSEVAVAADSRGMITDPITKKVSSRDDQCKIAAFRRKFIFAAAGRQSFEHMFDPLDSWNSQQLVASCLTANSSSLRMIAECWGAKAAERQENDLRRGVMAARERRQRDILTGLFAEVREGRSAVPKVKIFTDSPAPFFGYAIYRWQLIDVPVEAGIIRARAIGHSEIYDEYSANQTQRARAWHGAADERFGRTKTTHERVAGGPPFLIQITYDNLTGDPRNEIGGPVDEAYIDSSGIHWISRKDNCPENQ